jgi:hypothetical protein
LRARTVLFSGLVCGVVAAGGLYRYVTAPPPCDSEWARDRVIDILRDEFHLTSIFINGIQNLSGGYFANSHDCSAEIADIRGNVDASNMNWREIRYRIVQPADPGSAAITLHLGGPVPLARVGQSFWTRLLARL